MERPPVFALCVLDQGKRTERKFEILSLKELEEKRPEGWKIYFGPACLIPHEVVLRIMEKEKEIHGAICRPLAFGNIQDRIGPDWRS